MRLPTGACVGALLLASVPLRPAVAAPATPLASADTNWNGVSLDLMTVERKGAVLTVKWAVHNGASADVGVSFALLGDSPTTYVVDEDSGTKYYVLTDKEKHVLASMSEYTGGGNHGIAESVPAGQTRRYWAKFPAPPPQVKRLTVFFTNTEPFEDVAITDR